MPVPFAEIKQGEVSKALSQFSLVEREAKEAELRARFEQLNEKLERVIAGDKTDLISATKALRVSIDASIKEAQTVARMINRGNGGREVALSITKLQEAKMWAGQALGEYGHKLPEEYRDEAH